MEKLREYLPSLALALMAVVGVILALKNWDGTVEDWNSILMELTTLKAATVGAQEVAIAQEDWVACVSSGVASSSVDISRAALVSARDGVCEIPAVGVDVSACMPFREKELEGKDIPLAVELSISPLLSVVGKLAEDAEDPKVAEVGALLIEGLKAYQPHIISVIEEPGAGLFTLPAISCDMSEDGGVE